MTDTLLICGMQINPTHAAELERIGAKVGRIFSGEWGWIVTLKKRDVWILRSADGDWWSTDPSNYANAFGSTPIMAYTEYLRACNRANAAELAWINADTEDVVSQLARIGANVDCSRTSDNLSQFTVDFAAEHA